MKISVLSSLIVGLFCSLTVPLSASADLPVPERPAPGPDVLPADMGWSLVWSDEFDGADLDFTKWGIEESCWGGGNWERQCYTNRYKNVEVVNGLLRLKAFRETVSGPEFPVGHPEAPGGRITKKYTSGKVRTLGLADWTYGRFSARIKLPKGQGTWPAFWMLPADNAYGEWASSGEIDIMEAVNLGARCNECEGDEGENRTSGALHFGDEWPNNTYHVQFNRLPGGANSYDEYHVYSVEWGEGLIHWFVDDVLFYTLTSDDWYSAAVGEDSESAAPFDMSFYLMLNFAVGGSLSEDNNSRGFDRRSYPSQMLVDWVRVYQCAPDLETGLACMQGTE